MALILPSSRRSAWSTSRLGGEDLAMEKVQSAASSTSALTDTGLRAGLGEARTKEGDENKASRMNWRSMVERVESNGDERKRGGEEGCLV